VPLSENPFPSLPIPSHIPIGRRSFASPWRTDRRRPFYQPRKQTHFLFNGLHTPSSLARSTITDNKQPSGVAQSNTQANARTPSPLRLRPLASG
jgi:hypothetical protein